MDSEKRPAPAEASSRLGYWERNAASAVRNVLDKATEARGEIFDATGACERAGLDGDAVTSGLTDAWRRLDDARRALLNVLDAIEGRA